MQAPGGNSSIYLGDGSQASNAKASSDPAPQEQSAAPAVTAPTASYIFSSGLAEVVQFAPAKYGLVLFSDLVHYFN